MPKNIYARPFDLISPDGYIKTIKRLDDNQLDCIIEINSISSSFKGFTIDPHLVQFILKSTFAQLGINGTGKECELSSSLGQAQVRVLLTAFAPLGIEVLKALREGVYIGKLFAADDRRVVRSPDYLLRQIRRTDAKGNPLLLLSEEYKSEEIIEQKEQSRTIVKIPLLRGFWQYDEHINGLIHTLLRGLRDPHSSFRRFLPLHHIHHEEARIIPKGGFLLSRSAPLNISTLFARIIPEELPKGFLHTSAQLIEPQQRTQDVFEFYGDSQEELHHIPLEFFTLEPHREHVFFSDRGFLRKSLEDPAILFKAFETAPAGQKVSTFIVKSEQLLNLKAEDWIIPDPVVDEKLVIPPTTRQQQSLFDAFIKAQSSYVILKSMQEGLITSQGILLTRYFPAPILKTFLLNEHITRCLKAIYFYSPSKEYGDFFSHDDRALLQDLAKASVDVFWVNSTYKMPLKYSLNSNKNTGMFVPVDKEQIFLHATMFGVYGSNILETAAKEELFLLFQGLLEMKKELDHDKLNPDIPIAIATGGGPGVMAIGNKIASDLGILSCGHAVDFSKPHEGRGHVEEMNPYIQALMTYRLEQVIVRQSEFHLDFPLFFEGGVGTDFEYALELLRTQVGTQIPAPILLFGSPDYWRAKITSRFQLNRSYGTIRGSEWVSNCFYCVGTHKQALSVYYKYFTGRLELGKDFPAAPDGFITVS